MGDKFNISTDLSKINRGGVDSAVTTNRIDLGKSALLDWPLVLYIEPSGHCNFKCKFCPQSQHSDHIIKDNLSMGTVKKVVGELNGHNVKVKKIRFTGIGEPLVNPDIINILKYIREHHVTDCMELITNGNLLNESVCKELPQCLDIIRISIEGLSEKDYVEVTGSKVDFDTLVSKIKTLYSHRGTCRIYIKIHSNAVQTQEKAKMFFDIFGTICDGIGIENLSDIWPGFESELFSKNQKFRYSLDGAGFEAPVHREVCPQIFKSLQIYANGDVVPCCVDWERKLCIGNLNEKSLYEIWKGKELFDLRMKHLNLEKNMVSVCQDCVANDYMEVDNLDPNIEEVKARMLGKDKE